MFKKPNKLLLHQDSFAGDPFPVVPAGSRLPTWYKNIPPYFKKPGSFDSEREFQIDKDGGVNLSIKKCVPFMDSLSLGYYVCLNADVQVLMENNQQVFRWSSEIPVVYVHEPNQVVGVPVPEGYSAVPWKWRNFWLFETPKGYSSVFFHPLNQSHLPFLTLSGVVDTDKHDISVNFPFFLRKDWTGTIERGTPIAQLLPFKREPWEVEVGAPYDHNVAAKNHKNYFQNRYKKLAWSKKSFS